MVNASFSNNGKIACSRSRILPTPWIASMIAVFFGVGMAIITRQGCVKCKETGAISRQLDLKIEARGNRRPPCQGNSKASVEKIPFPVLPIQTKDGGGKNNSKTTSGDYFSFDYNF